MTRSAEPKQGQAERKTHKTLGTAVSDENSKALNSQQGLPCHSPPGKVGGNLNGRRTSLPIETC